jgi:hypothetical protein
MDSMDYFYMRLAWELLMSGLQPGGARRAPDCFGQWRIKRFSGKGLPRMEYLDGAYARQSVF